MTCSGHRGKRLAQPRLWYNRNHAENARPSTGNSPSSVPLRGTDSISFVRGLSNKEIAKQLGISSYRIQDHVNALLEKIGASNRVEAVAIALKKHLLKI